MKKQVILNVDASHLLEVIEQTILAYNDVFRNAMQDNPDLVYNPDDLPGILAEAVTINMPEPLEQANQLILTAMNLVEDYELRRDLAV